MIEKFESKGNKKLLWFLLGLISVNILIILVTLLVVASKGGWTSEAWTTAGQYLLNQVYLNNFFKQPALVLGFLVLIGYYIMGRGWKDSILGSLKTIIGYVLLTIGSGTLVGTSKVVFNEISKIGGVNVVPLDPYLGWSSANSFFEGFKQTQNYVSLITYVFIVGFAINIVLVTLKKWTNIHSLMITGHVMLQQSAIITTAFYVLLFGSLPLINNTEIPGSSQVGLVAITGLFLGTYWAIGSSATLKPTNKVTQNAGFAIGHQQMLGIALTYKISRFFGKPEDSSETRKMPKWLKIFEDNVFVQTLIITLLFLVLVIILIVAKPSEYIKDGVFIGGLAEWNSTFAGAHWILNVFGGSIKIVAALLAMITGVRMFVTELQQSFTGISEKLIPGTVVAIDIAAVYGFAPNAVTFGFISGTIGQFIGVGIVIGLSIMLPSYVVVVIPLFVTLFFNSGAIGPYANAAGGIRATLIVPALVGLFEIVVIGFALAALNAASSSLGDLPAIPGQANAWHGNPFKTGYIGMSDWNLFFGILMLLSGYSSFLSYIFIPVLFVVLVVYGQILDSGNQLKPTLLQKMLKLKPELVNKE